jgi:hypothetical protein
LSFAGPLPNAQLQTGLSSQVLIEQAKGVLTQRLAVSMDAAFDRLRRYARADNLRLIEVAGRTAEGELNPRMLPTSALGTDSRLRS